MAVSVCLFGCGRKAPPVPPRQPAIPAVKDLRSDIDGDMIVLTWTIPDENRLKPPYHIPDCVRY